MKQLVTLCAVLLTLSAQALTVESRTFNPELKVLEAMSVEVYQSTDYDLGEVIAVDCRLNRDSSVLCIVSDTDENNGWLSALLVTWSKTESGYVLEKTRYQEF